MTPAWLAVAALVVVAGTVWHLTWSAARLDRLHARVEGAWAALDAQLVRRASLATVLATSGLLDPARGLLVAGAANGATHADGPDRELAESDLSASLRAAIEEPGVAGQLGSDPAGGLLLVELAAASQRVQLARRFHNDAVRAACVVRRKRLVRALRLAGHAAEPATFEMDDVPPEPLRR